MLYYVTGGERSGKSSYAQTLATKLSETPVYVATARVWDKDFENRIQRHKNERNEKWINLEEEKQLSTLQLKKKVVVIDCVTLWLTNFYVDLKCNVDDALTQAKEEFEKLLKIDCTLIIISNEIGMGVHAHTEVGRKFVELQGWMNQHIAARANKVILMVSGIPVIIKEHNE